MGRAGRSSREEEWERYGWSNCSWKEKVGAHPGFLGSKMFTDGNTVPRQGARVSGSGLTCPICPPASFSSCGLPWWHRISCTDWRCRSLDTHSASAGCCLWGQAWGWWE